jgi:hypothetical protein
LLASDRIAPYLAHDRCISESINAWRRWSAERGGTIARHLRAASR